MAKWVSVLMLLLIASASRADDNRDLIKANDDLRNAVGQTVIKIQDRPRPPHNWIIIIPASPDPATDLDKKFFFEAKAAVQALLTLDKFNLRDIVPMAFPKDAAWAASKVRLFLDSDADNAALDPESIDQVIDHVNDKINPAIHDWAIENNDGAGMKAAAAYAKAHKAVRAYHDIIVGKKTARDS